jgi:predicted phage tail protein
VQLSTSLGSYVGGKMKKGLRYTIATVALIFISFFCVGSSSAISETQIVTYTVSEPVNMLLLGVGLIGMATFMKSRFSR